MPLATAHLQRRYQSIVIGFIVLVAVAIGGTAYAGLATTTIELTPLQSELTSAITVTVSPDGDGPNGIAGTVTIEERTHSLTVNPEGPGITEPAQARGTVTLHNESPGSQALVAGTRLESSSGVIVRITEGVTIPSNGTVEVEAVADPLGTEGEIPAGRLTIVALRPANQAVIYGTTSEAFTGGEIQKANTLSLDELTEASNQARQAILDEFGHSQPGVFRTTNPTDVTTSPSPETPSDEYTVTVTVQAIAVTYDENTLTALLRDQLETKVADDQALAAINDPELRLDELLSLEEASIEVNVTAVAQLRADSPAIQPSEFINLDRDAIVTKLLNTKLVDQVAVRFSPWWRTTTPAKADRIQVVIVEADLTNTNNSVESP